MQFSTGALLRHKSTQIGLAITAVVLFASANLPWQLEDYDQAKQAFTSFEMLQQGHWLYQHTPSGWIATKPPLVGWVSAGLFAITRSSEVAWRLPSFISALTLLFLIARVARDAFGPVAGVIAASAFALNLFAPRLATLVRTDLPLTLIIFLVGAQIWIKLRRREPWSVRDRLIAFILLSAAMAVKGPIVYAFLLPGIAAFWLLTWRREAARAWCGWWPWLASLFVFAAWVAVGVWNVPEFLDHVVMREFAGRFEGTHRAQPIYFYLPHLLHKFAPWSVLLLLFAFWSKRLTGSPRISAPTLWLICWSLGGLVVMSFVPSKRVDRIFPIVPPLCLLLATQFAALDTMQMRRRRMNAALVAIACAALFSAGYVAAKVVNGFREDRRALVKFGEAVRHKLAASNLRFDVVAGEDEAILLYLGKMEFTELLNAAWDWNHGAIEAVVVPEEKLGRLLPRLAGPKLSEIVSRPGGSHGTRYILVVRH
ncbi:MAG: ArnT family glycosyltransferase [Chthoniobacterales bacterium]